jgi:glucose/arabinose dehydrogenase
MVAETKELKTPSGIVIAKDDAVLVADTDGGRVVTWTEAGFTPVAEGLAQPTALALESPTVLLVAESAAGQIVRIDLASGRRSVIAKGLDRPMGLAVLADGRIAVAEPGKGTVAAIAPKTGARSALAANLPLSLAGLRVAQNMPVGLAVGADGTLYVACPADNSLVKIAFAK